MNAGINKNIVQSANVYAKLSAYTFICIACLLGLTNAADKVDSTNLIFNDSRVNEYNLHFYIDNWADSLAYYYDNGEQYLPARFSYKMVNGDSIVLDSVGVRFKGNSSYTYSANSVKKPFKLSFDEFRDQGFCGVSKLNFSNGIKDPSQMREKIAYDIISKYLPAPRAAFATISVDNKLIGLYTQVEQVDKKFLKRNFESKNGNLYKASDDGATLGFLGASGEDYAAAYELKTNETLNDWSSFIGMLDKLNNSDAADFAAAAGSALDIDKCLRYLAFNMVFSNFDSYTGSGRNFYLYDDSASAKYILIPWDLNFSFGIFTNGWNVKTVDIVAISNLSTRPLNRRILENDSLKKVYLSYISELIGSSASSDSVAARVDKIKELIEPFVIADTNKFSTYEQFVQNCEEDVVVTSGLTKTTYPGIKSFVAVRNANIRTMLDSYLPVKYLMSNNGRRSGKISVNALRNAGSTAISVKYEIINDNTRAQFSIYNCKGTQVAAFTDCNRQKGVYQLTKQLQLQLASGYYTLKMNAGMGPKMVQSLVVW